MNKRSAILFDLDGTLLPMDLEVYTKTYLHLLGQQLPQFPAQAVVGGVWHGVMAMMGNDGSRPNETRFWDAFSQAMGQDMRATGQDLAVAHSAGFPVMRTRIISIVISTVLGLIPFLFDGPDEVFWFDFAVGTMGGMAFSIVALLVYFPIFCIRFRRERRV